MNLPGMEHATAEISPCGQYRCSLTRPLGRPGGTLLVSMLNPSDADAERNDPTILRIVDFGLRWGFGRTEVINPLGLRSPHPSVLLSHPDPVGPRNAMALVEAIRRAPAMVLLASGNPPTKLAVPVRRWESTIIAAARAADIPVRCLGVTGQGWPKHPLARGVHRVPNDAQPIPYQGTP